MVYAYNSIKNCNRIMSKIVVFDVICCQHYALYHFAQNKNLFHCPPVFIISMKKLCVKF